MYDRQNVLNEVPAAQRRKAIAMRGRIDWKYLLGLELSDAGFNASVISELRTQLVEG